MWLSSHGIRHRKCCAPNTTCIAGDSKGVVSKGVVCKGVAWNDVVSIWIVCKTTVCKTVVRKTVWSPGVVGALNVLCTPWVGRAVSPEGQALGREKECVRDRE